VAGEIVRVPAIDRSNIPSASGSFPALKIARPGRRRSRVRRTLAALLAGLTTLAVVAFVVIGRPPKTSWARAAADRELRLSLEPGERLESKAYVTQRWLVDYERETHGVLAGTDRRLLFIGVRPGGLPEARDEPPAFDVRAFPYDTLTAVRRTRVFFGRAAGIEIRGGGRRESFGVDGDQWNDVDSVSAGLARRAEAQRAAAAHEALVQRIIAARPDVREFYTVKRGDALISIARIYGLTPDSLQRLNGLPDERVKIGQQLLVRVYRDLSRPPGM
jgi:LysM domain-containing protein